MDKELTSTQNNTLDQLNMQLFKALNRINDDRLTEEQINAEIPRLQAVCGIADRIVKSVNEQNNNLRIVIQNADAVEESGALINSKTIALLG